MSNEIREERIGMSNKVCNYRYIATFACGSRRPIVVVYASSIATARYLADLERRRRHQRLIGVHRA